jgi:hypothetical protein
MRQLRGQLRFGIGEQMCLEENLQKKFYMDNLELQPTL